MNYGIVLVGFPKPPKPAQPGIYSPFLNSLEMFLNISFSLTM
jgi:hypothetical protein